MMKTNVFISAMKTAVACLCLICFSAGCGNEEGPPQKEPALQKIPVERSEIEKREAPTAAQKTTDAARQPSSSVKGEQAATVSKQGEATSQAQAEKGKAPASQQPEAEQATDSTRVDTNTAGQSEETAEAAQTIANTANLQDIEIDFSPEERIADTQPADEDDAEVSFNPFEPLFEEDKAAAVAETAGIPQRDRRLLTPLEKMSLGQIEVKGIIRAPSGNRAIVTDAKGKGYVVKKGTYIGLNSGQVEKIADNTIVVVEMVGGRRSVTELKLQKDTGE